MLSVIASTLCANQRRRDNHRANAQRYARPHGTAETRRGAEALLRATVHVVAREGLRGLTYRAVAEEAGVANTLVAHHFGTRDALLQAALEWAAEQSIGVSLLEPATGRLEDFAAGLADLVAEDADMQAFQYELSLEGRRRPELRPAVQRMYRGLHRGHPP